MNAPTRPILRYHGGKWMLGKWIVSHFPAHRVYVEPFGGGASVLLQKERSYAEVYNDLDDEVVGLFEVMRDRPAEMIEALRLTPFARAEFDAAYQPSRDPLERARRLVVRSFMGFGSDGHNAESKTGFRANANRAGTTPAHDWANLPDCYRAIAERLVGVVVEKRDAMRVARKHDGPDTLVYFDPPYLPETRSKKMRRARGKHVAAAYAHEMTKSDHARFLRDARRLRSMVVISGYPSAMYDDALALRKFKAQRWRRVERKALADGAKARVEVLWINPACAAALERERAQMEMQL